tara:strand:- start:57 stop:644 length:588 start_codon:yes stop_codon:yes gene_type:complete
MIFQLKKNYKSLLLFIVSTLLVYLALSKINLSYLDTAAFIGFMFFLYLFKSNIDSKNKHNNALDQNATLYKSLSEFNAKLDDKFKKLDLKLDSVSEKKQLNNSIQDFPSVNFSIISSFNKEDTYVIDDKKEDSIKSNSQNIVLKRLSSLLKKNGQTLKKLKPFNKETFEKISTNTISEDDDFININFPTNLINSN